MSQVIGSYRLKFALWGRESEQLSESKNRLIGKENHVTGTEAFVREQYQEEGVGE